MTEVNKSIERVATWFRWLFRRGVRSSILLNMRPGDEIVSMIQYRQYLCISTRWGELYMLDGDRLVEFSECEIQSMGRMDPTRWPT